MRERSPHTLPRNHCFDQLKNWNRTSKRVLSKKICEIILPRIHCFNIDAESAFCSFVRSIIVGGFNLQISCLQNIIVSFALDHQIYSRWLTVQINEILSADSKRVEMLKSKQMIQSNQVQEQQNAIIKGQGSVVGLKQKQSA